MIQQNYRQIRKRLFAEIERAGQGKYGERWQQIKADSVRAATGGASDDLAALRNEQLETLAAALQTAGSPVVGSQEPPQDYRIFNRRQPDGSFRPLSLFFDGGAQ